nr:MAG TPA: hypothetical protein [Caudoviricetes sp.]
MVYIILNRKKIISVKRKDLMQKTGDYLINVGFF